MMARVNSAVSEVDQINKIKNDTNVLFLYLTLHRDSVGQSERKNNTK